LKLSLVGESDLATLTDLGLIEMHDDVPVLTQAGDVLADAKAESVACAHPLRLGAIGKSPRSTRRRPIAKATVNTVWRNVFCENEIMTAPFADPIRFHGQNRIPEAFVAPGNDFIAPE
jgi:hypothetical protein